MLVTLPTCYNSGDTVVCPFPAYDANGALVTISGLAVTDIEIYKGTSMTQRASDNGYTLIDTDGIDLDGMTGINGFSVDTSDNSDAGFWADGNTYTIVVYTITVSGQTTGFIFILALGYTLRPTTAGRKLDVSSGGEAGIDWANIGSPTTSVNLSGTSTKALEPTVAGRTLDVSAGGEAGIDWANVGTPGSTVSLSATTIATATNLTNAPTSGDFTATMKTSLETAVTNRVVAYGLDHLVSTSVTGTDVADNSIIAKIVSKNSTADWDTFVNTTDALEAIRDNSLGGTAQTGDVYSLLTSSRAEPGQVAFAASASVVTKIDNMHKTMRNRQVSDRDTGYWYLYGDDGVTIDQKAAISVSGNVSERGEIAVGP